MKKKDPDQLLLKLSSDVGGVQHLFLGRDGSSAQRVLKSETKKQHLKTYLMSIQETVQSLATLMKIQLTDTTSNQVPSEASSTAKAPKTEDTMMDLILGEFTGQAANSKQAASNFKQPEHELKGPAKSLKKNIERPSPKTKRPKLEAQLDEAIDFMSLEVVEAAYINHLMTDYYDDVSETAFALDISRSSLYRKIYKYHLPWSGSDNTENLTLAEQRKAHKIALAVIHRFVSQNPDLSEYHLTIEQLENCYLQWALHRTRDDIQHAAQLTGVARSTIYRRMKKW